MGDTTKTNATETYSLSGEQLLENARQQSQEAFKVHEVENTPFAIIEKDGNFIVVLGKYRLHEVQFKTKEEAEVEAAREDWERIMQVCGIMIANSDEVNELKTEIKELRKLWEEK
nr:MAG: hypothetical protein [Microvirus sp.]